MLIVLPCGTQAVAMFDQMTLPVLAFLLAAPVVAVAILGWCYRRSGGVSAAWAGVLFTGLCWLFAMAVILEKVR